MKINARFLKTRDEEELQQSCCLIHRTSEFEWEPEGVFHLKKLRYRKINQTEST